MHQCTYFKSYDIQPQAELHSFYKLYSLKNYLLFADKNSRMMLLIVINSSSNSLLGHFTNQIDLLRLADVALGNVDDAGLDPLVNQSRHLAG